MKNNKNGNLVDAGVTGAMVCLIIATSLFTCEKVPDHCGGKGPETWYNPDYQFCFAGKARDLCGGKKYNPLTDICENHILGTMCADQSFVPTGAPCAGYTLTTATVPPAGGSITRTEDGPNYPAGYDVILIAEASEGYTFAGWAGAQISASTMLSVRMDGNKPVVAMFNPVSEAGASTYTLFASAFPENGGTVTYQNGPDYAAGTQVTVTAEPKSGYTFTGWSGASTSTSRSVPITMDAGKTLVAMFSPLVYTLTAAAVPEEGGAVFVDGTALMGAAPQNAGTTVTALARPADGYVFTGWSGAASGTENPKTINISGSNTTLTARFTRSDNADQCAIAPQITPGCPDYNPCLGLTSASPGSLCCQKDSSFPGCTGAVNPCVSNPGSAACCNANPNHTSCPVIPPPDPCTSNPASAACCEFNPNHMSCHIQHTHSWTESTTPATCAAPGRVSRSCDCGTTEIVSTIPQLTGGQCESGGVEEGDTLVYQGQRYPTVKIGNIIWMAKNLNYPTDNSWCYNNAADSCTKYGRLYVWTAAKSACQGLGDGWRLPDTADWRRLIDVAGGSSAAGAKLKARSPNWDGEDTYGFSALPGGYRYPSNFSGVGTYGSWWSATENNASGAYSRNVGTGDDNVGESNNLKTLGYSVRCLRD